MFSDLFFLNVERKCWYRVDDAPPPPYFYADGASARKGGSVGSFVRCPNPSEAPSPRSGHAAVVVLRESQAIADMFVFGGWDGDVEMSSELFRLRIKKTDGPYGETGALMAWTNLKCAGASPEKRACFGFTAVNNNTVEFVLSPQPAFLLCAHALAEDNGVWFY